MNERIDLASGEWCNFMNCGDRFYSHSTIRELFESYFINCGGGMIEILVLSMVIRNLSMIAHILRFSTQVMHLTLIIIASFINLPLSLHHL